MSSVVRSAPTVRSPLGAVARVEPWVTTTGGEASAFSPTGMHGHPFEAFMPVMQQTARFCGMHWEEPLVIHGAHRTSEKQLAEVVSGYRARLQALLSQAGTAA